MTFADLIAEADAPAAAAITAVLDHARAQVPDLTEGVSYGVAALMYQGRGLIGIGPHAKGYTLFPFSGSIVAAVADQLPGYRLSKGAIGFTAAQQIPVQVVDQIVGLRRAEIEAAH
ncbi:MAG: hypothetical protein CVT62_10675 [Actinobacteria bacterium HGW-Actinobacteria-2]|nr:MAG: hypothetical protein CVT62_10675 [Actinobacteria bacterium HGW-Actinobacteria-2]